MKQYKTIEVSLRAPLASIKLNRPDVHHALNLEMIRELSRAFSKIAKNPAIRLILLGSSGKHFCAGADLLWMKQGLVQTEKTLKREGLELAGLFKLMKEVPQVILTTTQGKIMGGANGLVAASDLVLAASDSRFSFSEVKLGLVPATIAPFVLSRVGRSRARDWMLTGRSFGAEEAVSAGLAHFLFEGKVLETERKKLVNELLSGGPEALRGIKQMLLWLESEPSAEKIAEESASILSKFRKSEEGQKGMKAFLDKKKADWDER